MWLSCFSVHVFRTVHWGKFYEDNQKMHFWLNTLFFYHTYMFRLPFAAILKVLNIKEYNKKFV
jgi:hypothetical protein